MEDHNCILVTIINPGCYTLLSQEREHCSLVKHVEEQLAKEIEHYNKENYSITLRPHMVCQKFFFIGIKVENYYSNYNSNF